MPGIENFKKNCQCKFTYKLTVVLTRGEIKRFGNFQNSGKFPERNTPP